MDQKNMMKQMDGVSLKSEDEKKHFLIVVGEDNSKEKIV